jgi:putative transposase
MAAAPNTSPVRKRLRRREVIGQVRFLTFSCHRRLPLFASAPIREVFVDALAAAHATHRFRLYGWVLMPEHVHLLIRPDHDAADVATILRSIKQPVAQRTVQRWRELNARVLSRLAVSQGRTRFWQAGGGFDRNVRDADEFRRELLYIHSNPVKRGLVFRPADWMWSSARWYLGIPSRPEIDADSRLTEWVRVQLLRAGHALPALAEPSLPLPAAPGSYAPGTPRH